MKTKKKIPAMDDWEYEYFKDKLGSIPVKLIASSDFASDYEKREFKVYLLKDGKYATIKEEGCSCYELADAVIDLFPTRKLAMKALNDWAREIRKWRFSDEWVDLK